ncbi:hypothetical protein V12B01_12765 [Vibrio splendidus 12B01]|nr:hypothetical protein V12B01_12765 [Vibrio splendidus 12B01]
MRSSQFGRCRKLSPSSSCRSSITRSARNHCLLALSESFAQRHG